MSHISAAPLRTTNWLFQIGSKLARSACGTKRNVRAATRCEIAGVGRPPAAAVTPAPAAVLKNVRRSMMFAPRIRLIDFDGNSARRQIFAQEASRPDDDYEWWCETKKDASLLSLCLPMALSSP